VRPVECFGAHACPPVRKGGGNVSLSPATGFPLRNEVRTERASQFLAVFPRQAVAELLPKFLRHPGGCFLGRG
jgi:hypothetical protein